MTSLYQAKARLQAPIHPPYLGVFDVLQRTTKIEGFTALYRGFGAIVVGGTPGTMVYLCGYDYVKEKMRKSNAGIPEFAIHFASGMLAETLACIIYVPVDVIKERLQVQRNYGSSEAYKGSFDALKKIVKIEGLSGIYKGYGATLGSFGPFSALYFVFYERMKDVSLGFLQKEVDQDTRSIDLPFHYTVFSSATAGAVASWITSPLDMAKLRLQIQRGNNNASGVGSTIKCHRGVVDCLSYIYKEGGVKGLFRGAGARVAHYVPAMTITMTLYEEFRSFYSDMLNE
jgi:hypothetical protein